MDFKKFFEEYIKEKYNETDEWFYSDMVEDFVSQFDSESAFQNITKFVDFILEQDEKVFYNILKEKLNDELELIFGENLLRAFGPQFLNIVLLLIGWSGTTQIPIGLEEKLKLLEKHTERYATNAESSKSKIKEIKRHYRISE